jgi:hypothetical protein
VYAYRFPAGRFTYAEWLAAYRLFVDEDRATEMAQYAASISPDDHNASIGETDLIYLSLVSEAVARRVNEFREELRRTRSPEARKIGDELDDRWERMRAFFRGRIGRADSE